jgi:beta-glucosidase/6-phospho-beta-glucosidase/beta-galactosidase
MQYTLPHDLRPEQYKYTCARHVILAHAKAYRLFKKLNIRELQDVLIQL